MKKTIPLLTAFFIPGLILIFIFAGISSVQAQEKVKKEKKKTITLKIVTDDNGKVKVIDTTFTASEGMNSEEMKELIAEIQENAEGMKDVQVDLKGIQEEMKDLQVKVGDTDCRFDVPDIPHCFMYPGDFKNFDCDGMFSGFGINYLGNDNEGQTLTDLLGNIPIERVKSYSVKDRKGGKRIIIDLDDAPFFDQSNRVIIIKNPGRKSHLPHWKGNGRKIIIQSDSQEKTDVPENSGKPETPDKKEGAVSDTPKI